jgi:hypothetical protein
MSKDPGFRDPLRAFTSAGRLAVIATIIVAGGLFYWCVMFINDYFPSGSYPVAFFLIPVVIGAAVKTRIRTHVEFRSNKFPPYEGEEEQINPGLWGKRLAEYKIIAADPDIREVTWTEADK